MIDDQPGLPALQQRIEILERGGGLRIVAQAVGFGILLEDRAGFALQPVAIAVDHDGVRRFQHGLVPRLLSDDDLRLHLPSRAGMLQQPGEFAHVLLIFVAAGGAVLLRPGEQQDAHRRQGSRSGCDRAKEGDGHRRQCRMSAHGEPPCEHPFQLTLASIDGLATLLVDNILYDLP
ncbi:hypothetical protein AI27_05345 [Sphingomonas sp. BHC-A]|nr:hypothetical protein AI27_05345 [Sphingomonas sp. BHC-A]